MKKYRKASREEDKMKKSLEELKAIREQTLDRLNNRADDQEFKIVVGMATCGIAAGARQTLLKFMSGLGEKNINNITISQTGCLGMCSVEPIVEIYDKDNQKTTYIHVTEDKVDRIIEEHLINKNIISEFEIMDDEAKKNRERLH